MLAQAAHNRILARIQRQLAVWIRELVLPASVDPALRAELVKRADGLEAGATVAPAGVGGGAVAGRRLPALAMRHAGDPRPGGGRHHGAGGGAHWSP